MTSTAPRRRQAATQTTVPPAAWSANGQLAVHVPPGHGVRCFASCRGTTLFLPPAAWDAIAQAVASATVIPTAGTDGGTG